MLRFLWVFSVFPYKCWDGFLKLGNDLFLQHTFTLIFHLSPHHSTLYNVSNCRRSLNKPPTNNDVLPSIVMFINLGSADLYQTAGNA
jgi:hypothetical protein